MNYELLKAAIENEAKAQGVAEYEIYYMSSEELSVSPRKALTQFARGNSFMPQP